MSSLKYHFFTIDSTNKKEEINTKNINTIRHILQSRGTSICYLYSYYCKSPNLEDILIDKTDIHIDTLEEHVEFLNTIDNLNSYISYLELKEWW